MTFLVVIETHPNKVWRHSRFSIFDGFRPFCSTDFFEGTCKDEKYIDTNEVKGTGHTIAAFSKTIPRILLSHYFSILWKCSLVALLPIYSLSCTGIFHKPMCFFYCETFNSMQFILLKKQPT